MIHLIANKLVTELQTLPFVEKITGIVKPSKITINTVVKTFPLAYNTNPTECSQSELMAFVPDSTKRSIIYFEDYGTTMTNMDNQMIYFQGNMRLIVWFNYHKISPAMHDPSLIALNVLKVIPTQLGNFDGLLGVNVDVTGQLPNDAGVFSRYSYAEERQQYITHPYDYVAFTLRADFRVRAECIDDITICTQLC